MDETITGNHLSRTYWSLAEFADAASKTADMARDRVNSGAHDPEWYGGITRYEQALELARYGWTDQLPEALALAESAVEMADKEHMTDTFNPVWDVSGAEVDVARYLSGEPECMIDFPLTSTSKEGRVITLVGAYGAPSTVSGETLIQRGRLTVALALALSRLGHAVEIWADWTGSNTANTVTTYQRVLVKGVNDELDPGQIMFALAHPAMARALSFGIRDGFTGKWHEAFQGPTYGKTHVRQASDRDKFPEGAILLPALERKYTESEVIGFMRQYLGELGLLAE